MANDCLVKRLKGVANNDNLPKYGYFPVEIIVPAGKTFSINFRYNHVDVTDYIVEGSGEVTVTHNQEWTYLNFTPGTYKLLLNGKYNLDGVMWGSNAHAESAGFTAYAITDLNNFVYTKLQDVRKIEVAGILKDVNPLTTLTYYQIVGGSQYVDKNYPKLVGTISELVRVFPNLDGLDLQDSANGLEGGIAPLTSLPLTVITLSSISTPAIPITGNLSDISSIITLNKISFHNTQVVGSIEAFVEGQITNGKADGTVNVDIRGSQYTLNNLAITSSADYGMTIVYDSNGAIVSIDGDQVATYNKTNNTWTYN